MSKSIFIIDTPACCGECPMSCTDVCRKWSKKDAKTFPKDCPLKEVPEKKEQTAFPKGYYDGWNNGFNACP